MGNEYTTEEAFNWTEPKLDVPTKVVLFVKGYVTALLFGETVDYDGTESAAFEHSFHWEDFSDESKAAILRDCLAFYTMNATDVEIYGSKDAGSDYYFTRQGHGVGYWEEDHGTPEICKRLNDAAEANGTIYIYVNDNQELEYVP